MQSKIFSELGGPLGYFVFHFHKMIDIKATTRSSGSNLLFCFSPITDLISMCVDSQFDKSLSLHGSFLNRASFGYRAEEIWLQFNLYDRIFIFQPFWSAQNNIKYRWQNIRLWAMVVYTNHCHCMWCIGIWLELSKRYPCCCGGWDELKISSLDLSLNVSSLKQF